MSEWPRPRTHVDLGASALTCHIGFFLPLAASDELSERLQLINGILKSIYDAYGKSTQHIEYLSERNPVSVFTIEWRSIQVTLRFVLHAELVSLIIYIHVCPRSPHIDNYNIISTVIDYFSTITTMIADGTYDHLKMRQTSRLSTGSICERTQSYRG